jgi:predicted Zn-dependent protease
MRDLNHTERLEFGSSRLPGFWDTHPSTQSRVAEAAARANMIKWTRQAPIAADRIDYLRLMDGLPVGARAAEGVFVADRFMHADLDLYIHFPPSWKTINTHSAVGAISPKRDAQIFLEIQGPGDDVERAAGEYVAELAGSGFRVQNAQPLRIGTHKAFRVEGQLLGPGGALEAQLTWLARGASIYRFTALAPVGLFQRYAGTFLNVPRSLRSLADHERAMVQEMRLRIAVALSGENLAELSERTANRWDIQQTAVMNDLFADHVLVEGQLVKIAVNEGYLPGMDEPAAE